MNKKDNLISCMNRKGYEEVPIYISLCPSQIKQMEEKSDLDSFNYFDKLGISIRNAKGYISPNENVDWAKYYNQELKQGTTFSEWGVASEPGKDADSHFRHMLHPLKDFDSIEQFEQYPWLDFNEKSFKDVPAFVKDIHEKGLAVSGMMACTIWEASWYLRDMQVLMMDMAIEDEKAIWLLDKVTDIGCKRAVAFAKAGVDILMTGDDVGMQSRMMMSPDFWRQWIKPRFAKIIKGAKMASDNNLLVWYHSCGFIEPVIPDLIEIGVDILNPIQPESMSFEELHKLYGDRLSFWGTIGTQTTMPFGSTEDVKKEVWRNLDIAGSKGGLLPCPTHVVEPEVPWKNIEAYFEACKEYKIAGR